MTLFELIFILFFLLSVGALVLAFVLGVTGCRPAGRKILLATSVAWAVYLVVVGVSDVLTTPRVTPVGGERCFDEMCFTVLSAKRLHDPALPPEPEHAFYLVRLRITSRSRGRTQAEGGLRARLYQDGYYYERPLTIQHDYERECGKSPELTERLAPGESVVSALVFDWRDNLELPPLTLDHGFTPGYFVIGESPFFHKPDTMLIPPVQDTTDSCAAT
ncbi:MAG TPA: hypothetical protein VGN16_08995 [Acidobacteriaceae bacterium]|jgi:hypothetical protein